MFGWLNNDIGGYSSGPATPAQDDRFGSQMTDIGSGSGTDNGASASGPPVGNTGVTWANIIKMLQMSNSKNNNDMAFMQLAPNNSTGKGQLYKENVSTFAPITPTMPQSSNNNQQNDDAMSWLMKLYTGGTGGTASSSGTSGGSGA